MAWEAEVAKIGGTAVAAFFLGRLSKRLDRRADLKDRKAVAEQARREAEAQTLKPLVPLLDHVIERLNWYIGMLENRQGDNPSPHAVELEKLLRNLQAAWSDIYAGISDSQVRSAWAEIKVENLAHDWERLSSNPNNYGKDRLLFDYEELSRLALECLQGFEKLSLDTFRVWASRSLNALSRGSRLTSS